MTSEVRPFEVKHLLHKDVFHPKAVRLVGFTKVGLFYTALHH